MDYELIELDPITIAGITLHTDNSEAGFAKIQQHWGAFFQQGVQQQLGVEPGTDICEAYFDRATPAVPTRCCWVRACRRRHRR